MLRTRTEPFAAAAAAAVNIRPRVRAVARPARRHGRTAAENTLTSGLFFSPLLLLLLCKMHHSLSSVMLTAATPAAVLIQQKLCETSPSFAYSYSESRTCHFLNYKHRPLETVGTGTDSFLFFFLSVFSQWIYLFYFFIWDVSFFKRLAQTFRSKESSSFSLRKLINK